MDGVVTAAADDQGLALPCSHDLDPHGLLPSPSLLQIRQLAEVVHFTLLCCSAELTGICEQPFEQLIAVALGGGRVVVDEDDRSLSSEWDAAKACHQWRLARAFHADF
jgi:hypothetical protein